MFTSFSAWLYSCGKKFCCNVSYTRLHCIMILKLFRIFMSPFLNFVVCQIHRQCSLAVRDLLGQMAPEAYFKLKTHWNWLMWQGSHTKNTVSSATVSTSSSSSTTCCHIFISFMDCTYVITRTNCCPGIMQLWALLHTIGTLYCIYFADLVMILHSVLFHILL